MTIPATTISDYPVVGSLVWLSARDDGALVLKNLTHAISMTEGHILFLNPVVQQRVGQTRDASGMQFHERGGCFSVRQR